MFKYKVGMIVGAMMVLVGILGLVNVYQQKETADRRAAIEIEDRRKEIDRKVAAENSKKAEATRRAMNSPLPGKIFDFDNKDKK